MENTEVAVVGAGFAGMTAALYAARAGARVMLLEKAAEGGQILTASRVENYPALGEVDGVTLAERLAAQVRAAGAELLQAEVTEVTRAGLQWLLQTEAGEVSCRALILAVGAKRRRLGVAGEERLAGRGVSWCATCDGNFFRGRDVAVIGGGNTAFSEAIGLAAICHRVTVLYRSEEPRAERSVLARAEGLPNLVRLSGSRVTEILGGETVTGVRVERDGRETVLAVSGVFEAVGTVPDTAPFASLLPLAPDGGIVTDGECRTALPEVFAVGDCRAGAVRQLVTAAADGAVAGILAVKESFL
ncbi:MAG TPA: thioredoxin-disulfide reductase [Clostridiales bacterium]|nr:thioredoxin-disulfide reductase [Clostridiales bacterium]